jgi:hypothetical protein
MSKPLNPGKKTVELSRSRPSRIRRDPVRAEKPAGLANNAWWESREWEIRLAVGGIIFFAIAISALVIDIGEVLSQ